MAGKQADNTLHENAVGWAILLAVMAVLLYIFWYYYDAEVRDLVRWIRYGEMWVIGWFVGDDYTVLFKGVPVNWRDGFEDTVKWRKEELTFEHLTYFTSLGMQPLKYIFIGLMALGALWCLFAGPGTSYRSKMDLQGLIARQAPNFKVISPFVKFNPSTQPPRPPGSPVPAELPLFAEALGPEEWLAYHAIPVPDGNIDPDGAATAFKEQLGPRWKGATAIEPYKQILLACFCLKAARKRGEADDMLGRLASCWSFEGGLKLSKDGALIRDARKVLKDSALSGKLLTKVNRHAFETTAMLRALQTAREEGGVLAPATFVWLRAHDRTLWYPLNNLGRQSFHIEALGAMSHFRAEKMTQRPIPVPKVEDAVATITEYMKSIRARPIPQLDYSNSKKRGIKKAR